MKKVSPDVSPSTPTLIMSQMIAMDLLTPNPYNARKQVDKIKILELKDSLLKLGVLVPLIVRPLGDKFEIIAGWRRYTAGKIGKLPELPCQVRDLSDADAYEIMIIENLHREEIHPLDEAKAFKYLLKEQKIEDVSTKIGKSISYVTKRLQLNKLIKAGEDAYYAGDIHLAQAFLICRHAPADQERIMKENWETYPERHFKSETALKQWIYNNLFLDMKTAPFDLLDAELDPKMGSCDTCAFRSKNSLELFEDISGKDRCTVPSCFKTKTDAHLKQVQAKMKAEHGQVLAGAATWREGAVKIGGKEVQIVKKGPDTIPVVISKVDAYSKDEKKNIGKVVYISKDYNKPEVKEQEVSKNDNRAVPDKQEALRVHLIRLIIDLFTKGKVSAATIKNADLLKTYFIEGLFDGGYSDIETNLSVLCLYYGLMPMQEHESWQEYNSRFDALDHADTQKHLATVVERLDGIPASHLLVIVMALNDFDSYGDVNNKSVLWTVCDQMGLDIAGEKKTFSKNYDKFLSERKQAIKNPKPIGEVIDEIKKSKGKK